MVGIAGRARRGLAARLALILAASAAAAGPAAARGALDDGSDGGSRGRAALVAELRARPQDAQAHLRHARLLSRDFRARDTADWRPAAAAYEFALQLDPSLSAARLELGRLYAQVGRAGLAQQTLAEYVSLEGGDASGFADLALAALRSGDLAVALWAGRKAAALSPGLPETAAAATVAGALDAPDAAALMDRLRGLDPARAASVARDVAAWRQGARLAAAQRAAQASASSVYASSSASAYATGSGAGGSSLTPQPLSALPGPCADTPRPAMAVIEAVIVRQVDESSAARGVNLLSALQLVARGRIRVAEERPAGTPTQNNNYLTLSLPDGGISYLLDILDDTTSRADVLARPSLVALDRTPSLFFSGSTISVPLASQYASSLEEKTIGVSLAVTPTFLSDDEMLLAVAAGRSYLEDQLDAQLDQGIQTTSNSVAANVRIRFGETLVLSGLTEREDDRTASEIPLVGRLPVAGLFAARRVDRRLRHNLLVLLTPRRPNETGPDHQGADSLLPVRYDRRLAEAVAALARAETPEAAALDDLARRLARADLLDKLPLTPPR
ncbi:hypothetical protein [Phenylobacterium sp.]|uniref:hypothetical protein n=1 Tax=Phenylobacterium sp. TaxID=1871053 RepID=UPI002FE20E70